ncbi:MAG TPA: extracellular solute-binding protein [Arsenicitalea sp.]|nr:extracellular solute-binding protein [Arsenicitalea sp.]
MLSVALVAAPPLQAQEFNWRQFAGTTITGLLNVGPLADAYVLPQLAEFEKQTGINVRIEKLTDTQVRQKLDILLAGKDPSVDFFNIQMDERGGAYTVAGYLANIQPYLDNPALTPADYNYPGDWAKGCIATTNVVKGAPLNNLVFSAQAQLLHIRTDLFRQYNVKVPETLDELEDAAKKLTIRDASGNVETYGFLSRGAGLQATASFGTYLRNFGGSWFKQLNGEKTSNIASKESVDAFEYYGRLIRSYAPAAALTNNQDANANLFASGKVAILSELNYFVFNFNDPARSRVAGKVATILVPRGVAGSFPNIPTNSFAISNFSQKKDATWLFLAWITGKKQLLLAQQNGAPVCRESAWTDPSYKAPSAAWGAASEIAIENGRALAKPPAVAINEVREAVGKVIDVAIRNGSRAAIQAEADKEAAIIDALVAKTEKGSTFTGPDQIGPSVTPEDQRRPIDLVGLSG